MFDNNAEVCQASKASPDSFQERLFKFLLAGAFIRRVICINYSFVPMPNIVGLKYFYIY